MSSLSSSPIRAMSSWTNSSTLTIARLWRTRVERALHVRAEYLTEMRKKAGLTQAEVAEAMGASQQRVSAIESGGVAELATLADYIRALGGELKVIADLGDSWRRVA